MSTASRRSQPSPFVLLQRDRLCAAAALGPVLDLACGRGRHACLLGSWGLRVVALDRDRGALADLAADARSAALPVDPLCADAETAAGLPFPPASFGAIVVTRFLFRPLSATLVAALKPAGLLVYETFTERNRIFRQGPVDPKFLLREGELPGLFPGLEVLAFQEGPRLRPGTGGEEAVASLAARKPCPRNRSS
ncbi:methyltransferase domain-containing protein [Myxococcota bacterium]|nr:methyltransferase domain-containing protein [Myxococcota bacterium]MCZ7618984.1 methyltransferase domain-containing protein [Myxococcota bacterium]